MQAVRAKSTVAPGEFQGDYWRQSRGPLASLAFVAPLLALYEAGVLWLGPQAMRNGADVWLRQLLEQLGFAQYFLLPLLTIAVLAGWHYVTRQPWHVSAGVLYAKLAECILLSLGLVVVARVQGTLLSLFTQPTSNWALHASIGAALEGMFRRFVGFLGAGIYEELLFRLMLLPAVAYLLRWFGCSAPWSLAGAALLTSITFAAAHHLGALGEPFAWYAFVFRINAGLFFAALFVYRGFGIAAGTHAAYDILVGLF
jgi:membrane protease YdiL (CAAX protease family)